jgi:hypothetical protein
LSWAYPSPEQNYLDIYALLDYLLINNTLNLILAISFPLIEDQLMTFFFQGLLIPRSIKGVG